MFLSPSCPSQEYEIDKTLGIKGPDDVAKMGIAEYNKQCRNIVMRYSNEWEVGVFCSVCSMYGTLKPFSLFPVLEPSMTHYS